MRIVILFGLAIILTWFVLGIVGVVEGGIFWSGLIGFLIGSFLMMKEKELAGVTVKKQEVFSRKSPTEIKE